MPLFGKDIKANFTTMTKEKKSKRKRMKHFVPLASLLFSFHILYAEENANQSLYDQAVKESQDLYKKAQKESKELYERYLKSGIQKSEEFYAKYLSEEIEEGIEKSKELYDKHLKEDMKKVAEKGKKLYEDGEKKTKEFYENTFGDKTKK